MTGHEHCDIVGALLLFVSGRRQKRRVDELDRHDLALGVVDVDVFLLELRRDLIAQRHKVMKLSLPLDKLLARSAQNQSGQQQRSFGHVGSVYDEWNRAGMTHFRMRMINW